VRGVGSSNLPVPTISLSPSASQFRYYLPQRGSIAPIHIAGLQLARSGELIFRTKFVLVTAICLSFLAQGQAALQLPQPRPETAAAQIADELGALASDAMQGRGSGTQDELRAATYLAAELRQIGVSPAGDGGGFIQDVSATFSFRGGPKPWHTRNVIGILNGSDPLLKDQIILLTAHLDHLGIGMPVNGDSIYNGADDDASGCVAVLQLARALAQTKPLKRTVLFVFFGSEETGGQGNQFFLAHPPLLLDHIVANLEFEMIGRPDPTVKPDELWLTGYDRSNLGPELARHGAKLVADPHPEQHFFQRSDNFALARRGIVAQTVSSYGLHKDYHQPSDDMAHVDLKHMEQAIASMVGPVEWLVNSEFKPEWAPGKKP
jgi:Peptidase family M28